jgi:hypothetical protein
MSFEHYLSNKGYLCFSLDAKTGTYQKSKPLNVIDCLHNRWIHSTDKEALDSIEKGLSIYSGFIPEMRKSEVCFGFNQCHRPPTLIFPRPILATISIIKDKVCTTINPGDDDMNFLLNAISYDEIYREMRDHKTIYEIDRTEKEPSLRRHSINDFMDSDNRYEIKKYK